MHAAGGDDNRLPSPDVNRLGALVDIAIAPETFQALAGFGIEPRRVARLHSQNPARERHLPDQFIHVAVEHEPDALLPSTELERPRDDEAAVDPTWRAKRVRRAAGDDAHRIKR